MTSKLNTSLVNDVLVIQIPDQRLSEIVRIEEVGSELQNQLADNHAKKILVDFRHVNFMGSAMVGKIISLQKLSRQKNIDLRFSDLNENLMEVFELMQLTRLVEVYPTQESALIAFGEAKS